MSTTHDDERLDALLNDWADQTTEPNRLDSLQTRILSTAASKSALVEASEPLAQAGIATGFGTGQCVRIDQPRRAQQLAVGVAATLLLALGVFLGTELESTTANFAEMPPEFTWLQEDQLRNKAALLSEMESLFDGQLAWVAEDGNRVDLGLDGPSNARSADAVEGRRLAVRFVVVRRDDNASDWQVAWVMDVSSRPEELVRVASKQTPGDTLQLWSYQLPDGLIAVDCNLQLTGDVTLDARSSTLCRNGQPQQIAEAARGGIEYRVFQTVALLDREVG